MDEKEQFYGFLFNTFGDAILVFGDDRRCCTANETAVKLSGYSRSELSTISMEELFDKDHLNEIHALSLSSEPPSGHMIRTTLSRKDDRKLAVNIYSHGMCWKNSNYVVTIIRDTDFRSDTPVAFTVMHKSIDAAADLIFWMDADARFAYVNASAIRELGYSREELEAMRMPDINFDLFIEGWDNFKNEVRKRGSYFLETVFQRKNHDTFPVEITVNHIEYADIEYFYVFARDISHRKMAEIKLKNSERNYRILAENLSDGVGIIHNLKLVYVNPAFVSLLDYEKSHLIGTNICEYCREDYRDKCIQVLSKLEMVDTMGKMESIFVSRKGKDIWMEVYYCFISWEGRPSVLGAFRDITDTKLREMANEQEKKKLIRENIKLKSAMKERYKFGKIIGKSLPMQRIYEFIAKAAATEANVVIQGESGTGKELVARTIHEMSERKAFPFVPVNCGAIPESLFENEFFGHRKGAFTGANTDKRGLFNIANKGTLFLDEVGELTPTMQAKLLRAIETREYTPLGGTRPEKTDIRIISATNKNLIEGLKEKSMREDFLYRIHVIPIEIPPLRDRKEDIPLLVDYFFKLYAKDKKTSQIPGHILETLYDHDWPGNVRELQNVLKRYVTLNHLDFISDHHSCRSPDCETVSWERFVSEKMTLKNVVENIEKELIMKALDHNGHNRAKACKVLGIPSRTFYRKLRYYDLQ